MATNKPNIPQEEVDLGMLFSQIGKMFSNLFNFFGNIFKALYHYLILLLLLIKKNIIPIGIATIAGLIWGTIKDYQTPPVYLSTMVVKTNYGSAAQLYEKMNEVNTLLSEKDSLGVSELLQISGNEAKHLISIHVEPRDFKKDSQLAYEKYMTKRDTLYTKDYEYEDFLGRISQTDLNFHTIKVFTRTSKKVDIKEGLRKIVQTDYFIGLKNEREANVSKQKNAYEKGIQQFDSIRSRYNKVEILKAENPSSIASLNISAQNGTSRNVDLDLYNLSVRWLIEYENFLTRHGGSEEIISFIVDLPQGRKQDNLTEKKGFRYGMLGFMVVLFILGIIKFNKYLTQYEKETT